MLFDWQMKKKLLPHSIMHKFTKFLLAYKEKTTIHVKFAYEMIIVVGKAQANVMLHVTDASLWAIGHVEVMLWQAMLWFWHFHIFTFSQDFDK